jgi:hypothetical protein
MYIHGTAAKSEQKSFFTWKVKSHSAIQYKETHKNVIIKYTVTHTVHCLQAVIRFGMK